ncbi:hypothetical protein SBADM41S_01054 [Streptomyces badius]
MSPFEPRHAPAGDVGAALMLVDSRIRTVHAGKSGTDPEQEQLVQQLLSSLGPEGVDDVLDGTCTLIYLYMKWLREAHEAPPRPPPWPCPRRVAQDGDRWHSAGSLAEAAGLLPALGERVFLTTGRMGLAAFAGAGLDALWFLVRSVDAPEPPCPARMEVLLDRGPFDLDGERELLRRHRIDVLVTKDSGGDATAPKLTAAREAGIPVVVVRRPPVPEGVPVARTPDEAARWVARLHASG